MKKNSMTLTLGVSIRPSILRPFHVKTALEWLINYLGHKHLRVLIIHVASEKNRQNGNVMVKLKRRGDLTL